MTFGFAPRAMARRRHRSGSIAAPAPTPTPAPRRLPQDAALVAAWSADDIPTQGDDTPLAGWTDSRNRQLAGPAGAMAPPRYRSNALGTHPGIRFDGTMGLAVPRGPWSAALDGQEYTVIATVTGIAPTSYGALVGTVSANSDGLWLVANGSQVASYARYDGVLDISGHATPYADTGFTTIGFTSTLDAMGSLANNGMSRLYVNGGCIGAPSRDAEKGPTSGGAEHLLGIGALVSGGNASEASKRFAGTFLRLYVWSRCLTPGEMAAAERYIRDDYGQPYPWASGRPVAFVGDSITNGAGTGGNGLQYGYPPLAAGMLGLMTGQWWNLGIPGTRISDSKAHAEVEALSAVLGTPIAASVMEWYNQRYLGGAGAAAETRAYVTQLRAGLPAGSKILLLTSTDSNADQAAGETERTAYNAALVANGIGWGADRVLAVHDDPAIGQNGTASNAAYFADGIHLTGSAGPSGYRTLAGLAAGALAAL